MDRRYFLNDTASGPVRTSAAKAVAKGAPKEIETFAADLKAEKN